ncbi:MAG: carboxypeptidase-like regulatory domain-containing protein [Saprospiraceae bacterium]
MAKKSKTIQFQIPEPCSESWNKMHSLPGGRFCDNCEKTVVDFSQMTDNELVRFFEKNDQKLCGRFRSDQLDKEIELPRVANSFQRLKSIAAVAVGLLTWNSVEAQTAHIRGNIIKVETTIQKDKNNQPSKNKIEGIVKGQNGEVLIGVSIFLEKNKGTTTDIKGKFELEILNDWESFEVTFSYIGFETQVIEFDKKDILAKKSAEVKMMEAENVLTEAVVTAYGVGLIQGDISVGMVSSISCGFGSVTETKEEEVIKKEYLTISNIYPNPFVDYVNVMLDLEKDQTYLLHLYNASGQLIWAKTYDLAKGKQELRLDFSAVRMAQGVHFLRITDGNREIQTKKIIKVNNKEEMPQILSAQ